MSAVLLESGSQMLLESGSVLLLEDGAVTVITDYGYVCLEVVHPSCVLTVSKDC